jgi:hypothetical protein
MNPTKQPERYVVYWQDWEKCSRLAQEEGIPDEDVDPADFEEQRDFATLTDARRFYATVEQFGAGIDERVNFRWNGWDWHWDQERIEP